MACAPDLSNAVELVGVPHTQALLAVRSERSSSDRAATHKVGHLSGRREESATAPHGCSTSSSFRYKNACEGHQAENLCVKNGGHENENRSFSTYRPHSCATLTLV